MKMRFFFAGALMLTATAASAQTLRIGLVDDPDLLDPAPGKSFVGRIVFQSLCDKLVEAEILGALQRCRRIWSLPPAHNPVFRCAMKRIACSTHLKKPSGSDKRPRCRS